MQAEPGALPTIVQRYLRPLDAQDRAALRNGLLRVLIATNLLFGFFYLSWRVTASINWAAWPLALALLAAETYSYLDAWLFGITMWRIRERPAPPPPHPSATVDVFITCYNEPVDLVRKTVIAAKAIRWSHQTAILDDGNSPDMRAMAAAEGIGYIVRSADWHGKNRHAKAGNLNNALFQTHGEFLLILDADQLAAPEILDHTLGYFHDPKVAFVQTPQPFYNVPDGDPFGSHAPLFYGPIQQGKDGWNAAYFCGSNAVLRREALMHIGITQYVRDLEQRVRRALRTADRMIGQAERGLTPLEGAHTRAALRELRAAIQHARASLRQGAPIQEITWEFQRRARDVARLLVSTDLLRIQAELADIPGLDVVDLEASLANVLEDDVALGALAGRAASPLTAIATVRALLLAVDLDREDEAQPVMPMSTISVTEDMATAMRLHGAGWKSIYHHENLARGLAPEDLRTALQQRLRWAQGTIQVLLRESPLSAPGLAIGQRLMYFTTMWSYLSGFFSVIYLIAPVLTLLFGVLPLQAHTSEFFWHILPYLVTNQILAAVIGWRKSTWRGQQYSLALFPLWINAVLTAIGNVYFGHKLGFVVTPKTRQGVVPLTAQLRLVWPQLLAMALLIVAILYGLGRLALGWTEDGVPILVNVFWGCYDLIMLSVVIDAAMYRPVDDEGQTDAAR